MRLIILIPELLPGGLHGRFIRLIQRRSRVRDSGLVRWLLTDARLYTRSTSGGTLNVMRHGVVARGLGADVALATLRGRDTYGPFNIVDLPFVRWSDRRPDDVCLIPDFCSGLIEHVKGPVILYLQVPIFLYRNFDHLRPDVQLWTDSPFMLEKCRETWPGKDITIVPNVVDSSQFPFVPQSEREPGLIFAFPRKGPEFIAATRAAYAALGGTYWRFELIDGLPLVDLARAMRRPQAFLASAEVEGCALPPQESMAAGIVVVGKSARGANFAMEHRRTAMVAETPADAAAALRELEEPGLRETIARNAHGLISRYFPEREPTEFWRNTLRGYGFAEKGTARSSQTALGTAAITG
jgi:glycosyltransferase involved in cell wall biosynthesis